jgi:hypothetical protein
MKHKITWSSLLLLFTLVLGMVLTTVEADARRGGGRSFGGSRRSSGYAPNRSPSSSSYRSSPSTRSRSTPSSTPRTSFGGRRLSSSQDYTRSYGVPRRTERLSVPSTGSGLAQNYTVHRYGGMGDGFMMGYLTGASSWLWSMPFHPAFYYSRPYYVPGANGQMEVYPPTFSWTKLIVVLLIIGGVTYVVVAMVRRRRAAAESYSESRSSFG